MLFGILLAIPVVGVAVAVFAFGIVVAFFFLANGLYDVGQVD